MLSIYNSLSKRLEPFRPIEPGHVRLYVCGMTVYDYCHVGHARVMVVFDTVARYLRHCGYRVTYVRNITDIDDKIIRRAAEGGEDIHSLTGRYIGYMNEDTAALGVRRPDHEPRATEYIPHMLRMIEQLIHKGYAYVGTNGDVYYDVKRFPGYGKLSGKRLDELQAGARVEVEEAKRDPLDFVLWKRAKPGEPQWDSPWGAGRPGWHIECSAMATALLGAHFDIHGGGQDLQFPHHENEIAQSEAATGSPYATCWMHNGFVRVEEEKMSKSLGNFFTVREVLARYDAEELRYFILSSHYRSPLNYSEEHLQHARQAVTRLYLSLRDLEARPEAIDAAAEARFRAAMDDDFNTPEALAVLFDLAHEVNRLRGAEPARAARLGASLRGLAGPLGLLQRAPDEYLQRGGTDATGVAPGAGLSDADVEALVAQRSAARVRKDWAESDRLRATLTGHAVILEDGPDGTRWRRG